MQNHTHQKQFIPLNSQFSRRKRRMVAYHKDQLFRLPTVFAQNDPFLQHLYHAVAVILDDHPYPVTSEQFQRRTQEIKQNIQDLYFTHDQRKFLRRLMKETDITLVDLWQGSHIITLDNGYLYDIWSQSVEAHPRTSSHYKYVPIQQYGINFRDHQLLFGKTSIDGSTWFQMEAHGFDAKDFYNDPNLVFYHGQDFLKYRVHGMNVGPFGFSPHTETFDPIIRPYQPITTNLMQRQLRTRTRMQFNLK